jgi:hypothetical protein
MVLQKQIAEGLKLQSEKKLSTEILVAKRTNPGH